MIIPRVIDRPHDRWAHQDSGVVADRDVPEIRRVITCHPFDSFPRSWFFGNGDMASYLLSDLVDGRWTRFRGDVATR